MDNSQDAQAVLLFLLVLAPILFIALFLPTIIAFSRGHPNRWVIFIINVVFGFTGLAWLGALIWALHKVHDPIHGRSRGGESGLNMFANDVKRVQLEPPAVPAAPSPALPKDGVQDLERLANLYSRGLLSEQEFSAHKKRILDEMHV